MSLVASRLRNKIKTVGILFQTHIAIHVLTMIPNSLYTSGLVFKSMKMVWLHIMYIGSITSKASMGMLSQLWIFRYHVNSLLIIVAHLIYCQFVCQLPKTIPHSIAHTHIHTMSNKHIYAYVGYRTLQHRYRPSASHAEWYDIVNVNTYEFINATV